MRYLVTGGCGFIGSHLCEALIGRGDEVICVDSGVIGRERNIAKLIGNPRFRLEWQDVTHAFDFGPVDGIFHLASPTAPAETYKHVEMTLKVNSEATLRLLEMADKYEARFLFNSSIKVNDRITFGSTYIQGKILGEQFCLASGKAKVARLGNIYGPKMAADDSRVIPTFLRNIIQGKPLSVWGDGSQIDSFCYVDDCIKGLTAYMDSNNWYGLIEFGSPEGITILELAYEVLRITGKDVPICFEQPGGGMVVLCNNEAYSHNRTARALAAKQRKVPNITQASNYLRWKPEVTLAEGIMETYEYYKTIMQEV